MLQQITQYGLLRVIWFVTHFHQLFVLGRQVRAHEFVKPGLHAVKVTIGDELTEYRSAIIVFEVTFQRYLNMPIDELSVNNSYKYQIIKTL